MRSGLTAFSLNSFLQKGEAKYVNKKLNFESKLRKDMAQNIVRLVEGEEEESEETQET